MSVFTVWSAENIVSSAMMRSILNVITICPDGRYCRSWLSIVSDLESRYYYINGVEFRYPYYIIGFSYILLSARSVGIVGLLSVNAAVVR